MNYKRLLGVCSAAALLASILVWFPAISSAETNELIADPSLNTLDTNLVNIWDQKKDNSYWARWYNDGVDTDGGAYVTHDQSMMILNNTLKSTGNVVSPVLNLELGKIYTISFKMSYTDVQLDSASENCGISVGYRRVRDTDGKPNSLDGDGIFTDLGYTGSSNGWITVTKQITVSENGVPAADVKGIQLVLRLWNASGKVVYDDVHVTDANQVEYMPDPSLDSCGAFLPIWSLSFSPKCWAAWTNDSADVDVNAKILWVQDQAITINNTQAASTGKVITPVLALEKGKTYTVRTQARYAQVTAQSATDGFAIGYNRVYADAQDGGKWKNRDGEGVFTLQHAVTGTSEGWTSIQQTVTIASDADMVGSQLVFRLWGAQGQVTLANISVQDESGKEYVADPTLRSVNSFLNVWDALSVREWSRWTNDYDAVSIGNAHRERFLLLANYNKTVSTNNVRSNVLAMQAGQNYTVSFRYRTSQVVPGAAPDVNHGVSVGYRRITYNGNNLESGDSDGVFTDAQISGTQDWKTFTTNLQIPDDVRMDGAQLVIRLWQASGVLYVDDIHVTPYKEPTTTDSTSATESTTTTSASSTMTTVTTITTDPTTTTSTTQSKPQNGELIPDSSLDSLTALIPLWEFNMTGTAWAGWTNDVSVDPNDKVSIEGSDNKYIRIFNNRQNSTGNAVSPVMPLEAGKTYTIKFKVKYTDVQVNPSATAQEGLSWGMRRVVAENEKPVSLDGDGIFTSLNLSGSSDWKEITGTFTMPSDKTMAGGQLVLRLWVASGTADFDDVSVKEGTGTQDPSATVTTTTTQVPQKSEFIPDPSLDTLKNLIPVWEMTMSGTNWAGWTNNVDVDANDKVYIDGESNQYLTILNNQLISTGTVISPVMDLKAGQKYTLTFKVKYENVVLGTSENGVCGLAYGLRRVVNKEGKPDSLDGDGVFTKLNFTGSHDGWKTVTATIQVPADKEMNGAQLVLRLWGASGKASFDDVSVKPHTEEAPNTGVSNVWIPMAFTITLSLAISVIMAKKKVRNNSV